MGGTLHGRQGRHLLHHRRRRRLRDRPAHLLLHQAAPPGPQGVHHPGEQVRNGANGDDELADRVEEEGRLPARRLGQRWHLGAFHVYHLLSCSAAVYPVSFFANGEAECAVWWIRGAISPSTRAAGRGDGWGSRFAWMYIPLYLFLLRCAALLHHRRIEVSTMTICDGVFPCQSGFSRSCCSLSVFRPPLPPLPQALSTYNIPRGSDVYTRRELRFSLFRGFPVFLSFVGYCTTAQHVTSVF